MVMDRPKYTASQNLIILFGRKKNFCGSVPCLWQTQHRHTGRGQTQRRQGAGRWRGKAPDPDYRHGE